MKPRKPLTEISSQALLIRCAELLHVPAEQVTITSVARLDILGRFTSQYFRGPRDFRITSDECYTPGGKIPFPPPEPQNLGQPQIDELFSTTREEWAANRKDRFTRRLGLAVLLGAIVLTGSGLVWLFWIVNR